MFGPTILPAASSDLQRGVEAGVGPVGLGVDVGGGDGGVGLGLRRLLLRLGHHHAAVTVGVGLDLAGAAQAVGGAGRGDRLPLGAHTRDRGGEGRGRQGQPLDAHLPHLDAIALQHLARDLAAQLLFEAVDMHVTLVAVDQVGEVEVAGGDMHRRADEAAQLPRRLVRLVAHGAQELADVLRIARHAPGGVGLHQHAQAVASADVLQAGGGGVQAKVDRHGGLDRRRQLPSEARFGDHSHGIAQAGDHDGLVGGHHDHALGDDGDDHDHRGDGDADRHAVGAVGRLVLVGQVGIEVVRRHVSVTLLGARRAVGGRSFVGFFIGGRRRRTSVEVEGSWSGAKPSESSCVADRRSWRPVGGAGSWRARACRSAASGRSSAGCRP